MEAERGRKGKRGGREAVGGDVLTAPPPTSCLPWPAAIRGLRVVPCVQAAMGSQGAFGPRGSCPLRRLQRVHTHGSMRAVARTHGGPRGMTEVESRPGAILGQTQNWSQWRFCLCNICTRSFGANNPGLQACARSWSRGVALSFLLLLAQFPCCCGSSPGAVCCLVGSV